MQLFSLPEKMRMVVPKKWLELVINMLGITIIGHNNTKQIMPFTKRDKDRDTQPTHSVATSRNVK